jgi:hypothetical protein
MRQGVPSGCLQPAEAPPAVAPGPARQPSHATAPTQTAQPHRFLRPQGRQTGLLYLVRRIEQAADYNRRHKELIAELAAAKPIAAEASLDA